MVRVVVKSRWFGMFLFTFPALADTGPCLILNAQSLSVSRDTIERAWDAIADYPRATDICQNSLRQTA